MIESWAIVYHVVKLGVGGGWGEHYISGTKKYIIPSFSKKIKFTVSVIEELESPL